MNLWERVKGILLSPKTEWPIIEREPDQVGDLFRNYVAILAAIPAICGFIGTALIGVSIPGGSTLRIPIASALMAAIVGYVLSFVMVYVLAHVINMLAPRFGAQQSFINALKTAVYSSTAGWLAGIFVLVPALGFLGILALYGLYLVWTGLPVMMKAPRDRALGYTATIVVIALVIALIIGFVQTAFVRV